MWSFSWWASCSPSPAPALTAQLLSACLPSTSHSFVSVSVQAFRAMLNIAHDQHSRCDATAVSVFEEAVLTCIDTLQAADSHRAHTLALQLVNSSVAKKDVLAEQRAVPRLLPMVADRLEQGTQACLVSLASVPADTGAALTPEEYAQVQQTVAALACVAVMSKHQDAQQQSRLAAAALPAAVQLCGLPSPDDGHDAGAEALPVGATSIAGDGMPIIQAQRDVRAASMGMIATMAAHSVPGNTKSLYCAALGALDNASWHDRSLVMRVLNAFQSPAQDSASAQGSGVAAASVAPKLGVGMPLWLAVLQHGWVSMDQHAASADQAAPSTVQQQNSMQRRLQRRLSSTSSARGLSLQDLSTLSRASATAPGSLQELSETLQALDSPHMLAMSSGQAHVVLPSIAGIPAVPAALDKWPSPALHRAARQFVLQCNAASQLLDSAPAHADYSPWYADVCDVVAPVLLLQPLGLDMQGYCTTLPDSVMRVLLKLVALHGRRSPHASVVSKLTDWYLLAHEDLCEDLPASDAVATDGALGSAQHASVRSVSPGMDAARARFLRSTCALWEATLAAACRAQAGVALPAEYPSTLRGWDDEADAQAWIEHGAVPLPVPDELLEAALHDLGDASVHVRVAAAQLMAVLASQPVCIAAAWRVDLMPCSQLVRPLRALPIPAAYIYRIVAALYHAHVCDVPDLDASGAPLGVAMWSTRTLLALLRTCGMPALWLSISLAHALLRRAAEDAGAGTLTLAAAGAICSAAHIVLLTGIGPGADTRASTARPSDELGSAASAPDTAAAGPELVLQAALAASTFPAGYSALHMHGIAPQAEVISLRVRQGVLQPTRARAEASATSVAAVQEAANAALFELRAWAGRACTSDNIIACLEYLRESPGAHGPRRCCVAGSGSRSRPSGSRNSRGRPRTPGR